MTMGRLAIIEVSQETMQMLIIWEVQEYFFLRRIDASAM
jgi:hypothetical protein